MGEWDWGVWGEVGGVDFAVEAGGVFGVAAAVAVLLNFEDECVLVAVGVDFFDGLVFAGGFAFVPDFVAAAAPVDGLAEGEGHFEGGFVHVGEHEGLVGEVVDGDGWDEAIFVEFGCEGEVLFDGGFVEAWGELDLVGL